MVTCRLTACTPGSVPGPTLGIEYGKPLPFTYVSNVMQTNTQPTTCPIWTTKVISEYAYLHSKSDHNLMYSAIDVAPLTSSAFSGPFIDVILNIL